MKQLVTVVMAGFLGLALTTSVMAIEPLIRENQVKKPVVVVEGKSTEIDLIIEEDSRMLVPLRYVAEGLGCQVNWLEETREIVVQGNHEVRMKLGDNFMQVDGKKEQLSKPVRIVNSRAIVPLRFISEHLGFTVTYDREKHSAYLFREKKDFYLYAQDDQFTLVVANQTEEPINCTFSSGMTHDFVLKQKNQEIWRWSADKAFIMMIFEKTLNPGECWVYSSKLDQNVSPGEYTLESHFMGWDGKYYTKDLNPVATLTYTVKE
ncbi:MAG: hypothetical protein GX295_09075 [Syntrophomonadaceae bacterium]|nr:hypothetical protein [Syntrophomonadaceae bacterium]